MFAWLKLWLARREMRRKVDWRDCEWSPQKAGERRLKETLIRHYTEITRIRIDAVTRSVLQQMEVARIIQLTNKAQHERAMAEYRKEYDIYRKRVGSP